MENIKFGLPHSLRKIGYFLLALFPIEIIVFIIFKEHLTFIEQDAKPHILSFTLLSALFFIIFTEGKNQDERIIIYKLKALATGLGIILFYSIISEIGLIFSPNSEYLGINSHYFSLYMGIIGYFLKLYSQYRKDEVY